ncbi:hypothetical protein, partial [Marinimicrobium locisalis]|uniref:hypothetical protein n=1 Tax=Marinimicrobium locisalis TaxID=546022 RepID=UPI003221CE66
SHGTNTWTLNQAQGGTLSHNPNGGTAAIDGAITFKDFGTLRGGSGADEFTVSTNYSGTLNGGDGSGNHLIAETSGNRWTLDQAFGGSLTLGSTVNIAFTQIHELTGSGNASDPDTLQARDGQNNRWSSAGGSDWHLAAHDNPTDQILFRGIANWVGGNENDTFELGTRRDVADIAGGGSTFGNGDPNNEGDVLKASGDSVWEHGGGLSGTLDEDTDFSAIQTIEASGGAHSLSSTRSDNLWKLTGTTAGSLGTTIAADSARLNFSGIATLNGGGSQDVFQVNQGAGFQGTINGTAGHNTLRVQDGNGDWVLTALENGAVAAADTAITFTGIHALEGEGAGHELTGPELALHWGLTGSGTGQLHRQADTNKSAATARMTFAGMENLTGGGESDTFQAAQRDDGNGGGLIWITRDELADFGTLDAGGGGAQALLLTNVTGEALDFSLGNHADSDLHIRGFDTLEAHGADNILRGRANTAYEWRVTGDNEGTVSWGNETPKESLSFSNIASLHGGDRTDQFEVVNGASLSGVINGESGTNILDLSALERDIVVNIGQAEGLGVGFAVQNINGLIGNHNPGDPDGYDSTFNVSADGESGRHYDWQLEALDTLSGLLESDGVNDGRYRPNTAQEVAFVDFNILEGSEGSDTFTFVDDARVTGRIDGMAGDDNTYDAANATGAHHLTLDPDSADGPRTLVQNIRTLKANGNPESSLRAKDEQNTWTIDRAGGGLLLEAPANVETTFEGFGHLIGGTGTDTFTLQGSGRVDRIDGGGNLSGNSVTLEAITEAQWVSLDAGNSDAHLRLSAIGEVTATGETEHHFEAAALPNDQPNEWVLKGRNAGTLNGEVTFSGFAHLVGNAQDDEFTLQPGDTQATEVTGSLTGGGGEDSLNLENFGSALRIAIAERDQAELVIHGFDELIAPEDAGHTLMGKHNGNLWQITGPNSGELNELTFAGVSDLLGGDGDDRFEYGLNGALDGHLDGGERNTENRLDLSALNSTTVIYGPDGDFSNIDKLIGAREHTTLQGVGANLEWLLDQGENAGSVTRDGQTLNFTQVTDLKGGDAGNEFELQGGWVSGLISGGAQNDQFYVTLASGAQGSVELAGGGGTNNTLRVTGGGSGYESVYTAGLNAQDEPDERLTYTSANDAVYELKFNELQQVQDDLTADELRLEGTLDSDTLRLTDQGYEIDGFTPLQYTHKTHVTVAGTNADQLIIEGALDIAGTLTLRGAQVSQSNAQAIIRARHLKLEGIDGFGTQSQPIYSDVNQLSADVGLGGLFIRDDSALSLNAITSRGPTVISAAGMIDSDAALTMDESLDLHSERAGIRLTGRNRFSGPVSATAAGDVRLHHGRALTLGELQARELTLEVAGDITGQGPVEAERVYLDAAGQVLFEHEGNAAGELSVSRSEQLTWRNSAPLTVREVDSDGAVVLQAAGLTVAGEVTGASAMLDSRNGLLRVDESLTARGE